MQWTMTPAIDINNEDFIIYRNKPTQVLEVREWHDRVTLWLDLENGETVDYTVDPMFKLKVVDEDQEIYDASEDV